MHKFIGKNDIILMASILAASILVMLLMHGLSGKGVMAIVYVNGEETGKYPLSEDITVDIDGVDRGHNTLTIAGGKAFMSDASCPDKLCMHQGRVSKGGQSIVCLPNRVVVRIEGESDSGYDAVTR